MRWLIGLLALSLAVACAAGKEGGGIDEDGGSGPGGNTTTSNGTGGATTSNGTGGATTSASSSSNGSSSSSSSSSTSSSSSASSSSSSGGSGGSCYNGQGACNPMIVSCAAGEACDVDSDTTAFVCYPPPNDVSQGGACDNAAGPFCAHGLSCVSSLCQPFCCTDGDCGAATCTEVGTSGSIVLKACI